MKKLAHYTRAFVALIAAVVAIIACEHDYTNLDSKDPTATTLFDPTKDGPQKLIVDERVGADTMAEERSLVLATFRAHSPKYGGLEHDFEFIFIDDPEDPGIFFKNSSTDGKSIFSQKKDGPGFSALELFIALSNAKSLASHKLKIPKPLYDDHIRNHGRLSSVLEEQVAKKGISPGPITDPPPPINLDLESPTPPISPLLEIYNPYPVAIILKSEATPECLCAGNSNRKTGIELIDDATLHFKFVWTESDDWAEFLPNGETRESITYAYNCAGSSSIFYFKKWKWSGINSGYWKVTDSFVLNEAKYYYLYYHGSNRYRKVVFDGQNGGQDVTYRTSLVRFPSFWQDICAGGEGAVVEGKVSCYDFNPFPADRLAQQICEFDFCESDQKDCND